ncbi:hypothetical protein OROGR_027330 [Orobanche gracilis]
MIIRKTHYDTIGVKEDATHEEIRKTYRSSVLNFHPDKKQKPSETSNAEQETSNQFLDVRRAWEVLGDPRSRVLYDNKLRESRQDAVNAEDVGLDDMIVEDVGSCFELSYNCRCGDFFWIDSSELVEMGYPFLTNDVTQSLPASIILPCGSCSHKIRLVVDANVKFIPFGLSK